MTDLALPGDYPAVLADLKRRVADTRYRVQREVNSELIQLYWQIGNVLGRQTDQGEWATR